MQCTPHVLMLVTYIKLINPDWIIVRWWEETKKKGCPNIEFLIMNLFFFHMRFMMVVL